MRVHYNLNICYDDHFKNQLYLSNTLSKHFPSLSFRELFFPLYILYKYKITYIALGTFPVFPKAFEELSLFFFPKALIFQRTASLRESSHLQDFPGTRAVLLTGGRPSTVKQQISDSYVSYMLYCAIKNRFRLRGRQSLPVKCCKSTSAYWLTESQ